MLGRCLYGENNIHKLMGAFWTFQCSIIKFHKSAKTIQSIIKAVDYWVHLWESTDDKQMGSLSKGAMLDIVLSKS